MSVDKYLIAVGLSDERVAHLRLLLRRSPAAIRHRWVWGSEDNADLMIVDPISYLGRTARDRAGSGGRRCAVVSNDEPLRSNELRLAVPFSAVALANMLNEAADPSIHQGQLFVNSENEFGEIAAQFKALEDAGSDAIAPFKHPEAVPGLEELLHSHRESEVFSAGHLQIKQDKTTEGSERISSRSDTRSGIASLNSDTLARGPVQEDKSASESRFLTQYLDGELLGGPSALALADAPELVLDPKHRVFYSRAKFLQELVDYCARRLALSEWRTLTSMELQRVRAQQKARPYAHLVWLATWLSSNGRLAAHFPPGASFRLLTWPDIDDGAAGHRTIAEAMMISGRAHEIATRCSAEVDDVIDLINAYDAIGLIDVRRPLPPAGPTPAKTRLLTKLRHTFRKP